MRDHPQPELLKELKVLPLDTAFAAGRIISSGLHNFLSESVEQHPDSDVFSITLPTPRAQTLFISASLNAYKLFHNPATSLDRHPALTGPDTAAADIFAAQEDGRPGLLLAAASLDQKAVSRQLRSALRPGETAPTSIEDHAEKVLDLLVNNSKIYIAAYQACQDALTEALSPALFETTVTNKSVLHEKGLELAAISGLIRSVPLAQRLIKNFAGSELKRDAARVSPLMGNHDLVTSIAGIRTLATVLYWTLYNRSRYPDENVSETVTRTLRQDASPAVTMPRADVKDPDPRAIFMASPFTALNHPATFADIKCLDPFYEAKLTDSIPFGRVLHLCPSNSFTRPFLEGVLIAAERRYIKLDFLGMPEINPWHLVMKTPKKQKQGILHATSM